MHASTHYRQRSSTHCRKHASTHYRHVLILTAFASRLVRPPLVYPGGTSRIPGDQHDVKQTVLILKASYKTTEAAGLPRCLKLIAESGRPALRPLGQTAVTSRLRAERPRLSLFLTRVETSRNGVILSCSFFCATLLGSRGVVSCPVGLPGSSFRSLDRRLTLNHTPEPRRHLLWCTYRCMHRRKCVSLWLDSANYLSDGWCGVRRPAYEQSCLVHPFPERWKSTWGRLWDWCFL